MASSFDNKLNTGTKDEQFNLISALYHSLKGAAACETYLTDAQAAGDTELTNFFQEVQQQEVRLAERAKMLLSSRVEQQGIAWRGTTPEKGGDMKSRQPL